MNPVSAYLGAHYEQLGLGRFGITRRPSCILLTPRFRRSRHVIVLVLADGSSVPALVAKLPRRACDADGLEREAENLRAVSGALAGAAQGSVPMALAFERGLSHPLLLESALLGSALSPAALRRDRSRAVVTVGAWLERLALATSTPTEGAAYYDRLVSAPIRALAEAAPSLSGMVRRTLELSRPLQDAELPLVFEHGDFCHPNLLLGEGGRLGVLDWERAEPAGLPGHDLFFFLAYAADAGRDRPERVRRAFFGRRAWAWRMAEGYAARLGLDSGLLRPLFALSCARAVASSGGGLPRHMQLWRLALEETA